MMNAVPIVYVNGAYLPVTEAKVSVQDRGFRLGDGVFETMRVLRGVVCFWERHEARLRAGMEALKMGSLPEVREVVREVVRRNGPEGMIRLAVSRGVGSEGYLPVGEGRPTLVVEWMALGQSMSKPLRLWLSEWRRPARGMMPVNMKLAQGVGNTLARLEAQAQGCEEALMLSAEGMVCEAASANLFWVEKGTLYTPALETGALAGVTRELLLGMTAVKEVNAPLERLQKAEEVFVTNSRWGVRSVEVLQPQGWQWSVGPVAREMGKKLDAARSAYVAASQA